VCVASRAPDAHTLLAVASSGLPRLLE